MRGLDIFKPENVRVEFLVCGISSEYIHEILKRLLLTNILSFHVEVCKAWCMVYATLLCTPKENPQEQAQQVRNFIFGPNGMQFDWVTGEIFFPEMP